MAHAMPDATELTRQMLDTPGDALLKVRGPGVPR